MSTTDKVVITVALLIIVILGVNSALGFSLWKFGAKVVEKGAKLAIPVAAEEVARHMANGVLSTLSENGLLPPNTTAVSLL